MSCLQLELGGVMPSLVIAFYILKIREGNNSREHNFVLLLVKILH